MLLPLQRKHEGRHLRGGGQLVEASTEKRQVSVAEVVKGIVEAESATAPFEAAAALALDSYAVVAGRPACAAARDRAVLDIDKEAGERLMGQAIASNALKAHFKATPK